MSHSCPECGTACYCHGDIDDCQVETEEYAAARCTHPQTADRDRGQCDGEDEEIGVDEEGNMVLIPTPTSEGPTP